MQKIIIAGGQGFIGTHLTRELLKKDYEVTVLRRSHDEKGPLSPEGVKYAWWDAKTGEGWYSHAEGAKAVVNLAGENIALGRWTDEKKKRILESRTGSVRSIADGLFRLNKKPEVVVQASAIGFYGSRGEEVLTENSHPGKGFLADVCSTWEKEASAISDMGIRLILIRTSPVLASDGGFLGQIIPMYKRFIGGHPGNGRNWISWIHIRDEVGAIIHLIENKKCMGIYNLASPMPIVSKNFHNMLGRYIHRPSWLHVPVFMLNIIMGRQKTEEVILSDMRVMPERLLKSGFNFTFLELSSSLDDIVKNVK